MKIEKNEIFYADLNPVQGSEQGGIRPVLIIQNNVGNKASPTVIIAAITSKSKKMELPTHIPICLEDGTLPKSSMVMLEQIRTIDKCRLLKYVGRIDAASALSIERATLISLGIDIHKTYHRLYP